MHTTPVLLSALFATAVSGLSMTHEERVELTSELDQWEKSAAGQAATANGFGPPKQESANAQEVLQIELTRFAHTKKVVAALDKQYNGTAAFSTNNMFALMTDAEYKKWVKGALGPEHKNKKRQLRAENVETQHSAKQLAAGKDWTTSKCMPKVKNQGSCGSCWAFAAVGASEMAHCLATGKLMDLSEQQLVSCAKSAGQDCQGGFPNKATDYIAQTGLCSTAEYPYAAKDGQCQQSCKKTKLSVGKNVDIQGEAALQMALDKQPVTVVVEASNDVWRNNKSGIVEMCPGAQSDHAVIAVGYGT